MHALRKNLVSYPTSHTIYYVNNLIMLINLKTWFGKQLCTTLGILASNKEFKINTLLILCYKRPKT